MVSEEKRRSKAPNPENSTALRGESRAGAVTTCRDGRSCGLPFGGRVQTSARIGTRAGDSPGGELAQPRIRNPGLPRQNRKPALEIVDSFAEGVLVAHLGQFRRAFAHLGKVLPYAQAPLSATLCDYGAGQFPVALKPTYTPRELLAANVRKLMDKAAGMESPEKLAAKCRWPNGHKKAGKLIAPRTIRYLLDCRQDAPSPSVDLIFAIASALSRQPWELLADDDQTRHYLLGMLMASRPASNENVARAFGSPHAAKKP